MPSLLVLCQVDRGGVAHPPEEGSDATEKIEPLEILDDTLFAARLQRLQAHALPVLGEPVVQRVVTHPCDDNGTVVDLVHCRGRHENEITLLDAEHSEIARIGLHNEAAPLPTHAPVDGQVHVDVRSSTACGGHLGITRHGHRLRAEIHVENLYATRARRIALQEPLIGKRLQVFRDCLGAFDTEPLPDFADGGLVGVRAQILHHEIEDLPLNLDERFDPATGGRSFALCDGVGTGQLRTPEIR